MRFNNKVFDINTHPYLFEDVCKSKEDLDFAIKITGLYHNGLAAMHEVFARLDCAKIDFSVLSPLDLSSAYGRKLATNEQVKELVVKYPDYFIGFASVDPSEANAVDALRYAFKELDLKGVYLFPALQNFCPEGCAPLDDIAKLCIEFDRPMLVDCGCSPYPNLTSKYSHPLQWEEFIFRHPELRICLSRFAWPWNREMYMLMLKFRNVYTDTSIVYFDDPKQMYHQMFTVDMGPKWLDRSFRHQVMFGSGDPGLEQIRQINAIRNLDMREESKELILSQNALEFMGYKKDMRWVHD